MPRKRRPATLSADPAVAASPAVRRLQATGRPVTITAQPPSLHGYREGKSHLHVAAQRGRSLSLCASLDRRYLCCRVHVLAALSGCPYDCTYCFLQSYLDDTALSVVGDTAALIAELAERAAEEPWRFFRVGTWELGDSLALEPLVGTAGELVRAFADLPYALLELKTKSANVDGLLDLPHAGRTVISWTLSPATVARREEIGTAPTAERIAAMARVVAAGYPVAVHFDPMIELDGWEAEYAALAGALLAAVPVERIAWISLGSLRFAPETKRDIERHYPASRLTTAEMVRGDDGKVRYLKPLRIAMYRTLVDALIRHGAGGSFLYLCMERADVWQRIFDDPPTSATELDYRITASLHRRFPGLVPAAPRLVDYLDAET